MTMTFRKAIDVRIQATKIIREKGVDSFVKKITEKIDKAAEEGKSDCYVSFNNPDVIILDLAVDMLKESGYETHLNYAEHTLWIYWGYVKT